MPATCLRDGRRCLPVYMNICCRRNADTSPTLKHSRRQIVEVELDSTLPIDRRHHCHEMHVYGSSATYIFCKQLSARWRRQNKCDFPEVCGRSAMNLELVCDASATPFGCCRRHDCDVTALYMNQALDVTEVVIAQRYSPTIMC